MQGSMVGDWGQLMRTGSMPEVGTLPPATAARGQLRRTRLAQAAWGQTTLPPRLRIVRRLRHPIAG
jgi:hypothetical protein